MSQKPQNPSVDKPASHDELHDRPVVYFTKQGERYVDAGELLRSNAAKKAIESMMQIDSKGDHSKHVRKD